MEKQIGAGAVSVWAIKHLISPLQRWIYRTTGGRLFSRIGPGREVLLLTTKGHRSGKDRTVPLFYLRERDAIVVCNVRPAHESGTNPWVLNLRSHPFALLQIGSEAAQYHAREATPDELERLWPRLIALWPAYQAHHEQGGRRNVFILQRSYPKMIGIASESSP